MEELGYEEIADFFGWAFGHDLDTKRKYFFDVDRQMEFVFYHESQMWPFLFNQLGREWNLSTGIERTRNHRLGGALFCHAHNNSKVDVETYKGVGETRSDAFMAMLEKMIHANI